MHSHAALPVWFRNVHNRQLRPARASMEKPGPLELPVGSFYPGGICKCAISESARTESVHRRKRLLSGRTSASDDAPTNGGACIRKREHEGLICSNQNGTS